MDTTFVQMQTEAADALYAWMQDVLGTMRDQYGDVPFGAEEPDRWQQLENYLVLADNPAIWLEMINRRAEEIGRMAAWGEALVSSLKLQEKLKRAGGWQAIRMHQDEVRARKALAAMQREERQTPKDPITVAPPLPPQANQSLFAVGMPEVSPMRTEGPPAPAEAPQSAMPNGQVI